MAIAIGLAMLITLGFINYRSMEEFYKADQEVPRMLAVQKHIEAIWLDAECAEVVQLR